jgi:hypothetical protein
MRLSSKGRLRRQVDLLRQQFLQEGRLPFTEVLSSQCISQALEEIKASWNDQIFTPLVTLWVFLGQVLSADPSCRAAVARLSAHRVSQGLPPCNSQTGAYCQARKRLPLAFFSPPWPASWGVTWTRRSIRSGCRRDVASTSTTGRRSRCPTRRRTGRNTR